MITSCPPGRSPSYLDDHLGALVAGKERHVDGAALHRGRVLVHDGVHLGVTDIHVLVLQPGDDYSPLLILTTVSCQLSNVSCQLSAVSCQLSAVSCQMSAISRQPVLDGVKGVV